MFLLVAVDVLLNRVWCCYRFSVLASVLSDVGLRRERIVAGVNISLLFLQGSRRVPGL